MSIKAKWLMALPKHKVDKLGYYEIHDDIVSAIAWKKQIKAGSRADKMALIECMNSEWNDLYHAII